MSEAGKGSPQPAFAVFAIGTMALVLAAGMNYLGFTGRLEEWLAGNLAAEQTLVQPTRGGRILSWAACLAAAYLIPWLFLGLRSGWQRWIVWLGALFLTASWAPVLVLAARQPMVAVPWIAVFWSGFCAMIYVMNHPGFPREKHQPSSFDGEN